jgi:hypothetical protein
MSGQNNDEIQHLARCLRLLATVSETCTDSSQLLHRLTVALSRAMPIGGADVAVGENEKSLETNSLSTSLEGNRP